MLNQNKTGFWGKTRFSFYIFVCEAGIEVPFSGCVINAANCSLKSQETCSITHRMETHFQSQEYFPTTDASSHTLLPVNHLKPTKKTPFSSWLSFRKHRQAEDQRSHRVKIIRRFKLAQTSDYGYNVPLQFPKLVSISICKMWENFLNLLCEFPETCLLIFGTLCLALPNLNTKNICLFPHQQTHTQDWNVHLSPVVDELLGCFCNFTNRVSAELLRDEQRNYVNRWKMLFISDNNCRKIRWKPKHPSTLKKHLSLNWQRGKMRSDVCVSAGIPAP